MSSHDCAPGMSKVSSYGSIGVDSDVDDGGEKDDIVNIIIASPDRPGEVWPEKHSPNGGGGGGGGGGGNEGMRRGGLPTMKRSSSAERINLLLEQNNNEVFT